MLGIGCTWSLLHFGATSRISLQIIPSLAVLLQIHLPCCSSYNCLLWKNNPWYTRSLSAHSGFPNEGVDAALGCRLLQAHIPLEQQQGSWRSWPGQASQGDVWFLKVFIVVQQYTQILIYISLFNGVVGKRVFSSSILMILIGLGLCDINDIFRHPKSTKERSFLFL